MAVFFGFQRLIQFNFFLNYKVKATLLFEMYRKIAGKREDKLCT